MKDRVQFEFAKLHALGNDFIVAPSAALGVTGDHFVPNPSLSRLARAICDRHTGIGADGFLLVFPPRNSSLDARVRFFNSDGSEAEMSGNGIRCVAAFLSLDRIRNRDLRIETLAGVREIETIEARGGRWLFRVAMGKPVLEPAKIPFRAPKVKPPVVSYPLKTRLATFRVTVTSMGNPHCSLFVDGFDRANWPEIGREIENHPLFPNRTNVEFISVISRGEIAVRYWERGVGETASSGTGSCGAVVASILNGFTARRVRVRTVAGNLEVSWPEGGEVSLSGPAELIARGSYRINRRMK